MAQHREPPAYQEYASTMLAKIAFRSMSMEARGLLYTMRLECWANLKLPREAEQLSNILGKPVTSEALRAVSQFFEIVDDFIICPELEDYRAHLEERKKKQSEGGKAGAKITNKMRRGRSNSKPTSDPAGNSQVPRQGSDESLVQSSTEKQSQNQLIGSGLNYLNEDGTNPPLDEFANEAVAVCSKCSGEGCDWCKKSRGSGRVWSGKDKIKPKILNG